MYRYSIVLLFLNMLLSDSLEHSFSSALNSYTKTPDPGRVHLGIEYSGNKFTSAYDAAGNVQKLPDILLDPYWVASSYTLSKININATYHGVKGSGYKVKISSREYSFDVGTIDDEETIDVNEFAKTGVGTIDVTDYSLGVYFLWNEMYEKLTPAVMDGHQYTFPSTRVLTGLNIFSQQNPETTLTSISGYTAIDFIIGKKCIFSNKVEVDLVDDDNINPSTFSSKVIYDFSEKTSLAASLNYELNNSGDHIGSLLIQGGYQFKRLGYGHFNSTLQINPYHKITLFGENMPYSKNEFGLNLNLIFN